MHGFVAWDTQMCLCNLAVAGAVVQKRSPWRFSIIVDFFLAIISILTIL